MYTWSENYDVGHDVIDDHHRELFHMISSLDEAILSHDRSALDTLIRFLETSLLEHFQEEEAHMIAINYKELDYHQREHAIFTQRISDIRNAHKTEIPTPQLVFLVRQFIDRLVDHIITIDVQMKGGHNE